MPLKRNGPTSLAGESRAEGKEERFRIDTTPPWVSPQQSDPAESFSLAANPILSTHWPGLPTAAQDVRLSRFARHVYELGPRAIHQVLREIVAAHAIADDVIARLETYTAPDPVPVALAGGRVARIAHAPAGADLNDLLTAGMPATGSTAP